LLAPPLAWAADGPEAPRAGNPSAGTGSAAQLAEVVVTSSHIARKDALTSTPLTALSADDIAKTGAPNLTSYIDQLPAFLGGISASANDSAGAAGMSFLDLRGLGPQRTLVLVDGRRHVPSTVGGSVNIGVLPSVALQRIEVVTGGASAAWGSDAVAGVVNAIYDHQLTGVRTDVQYGSSQKSDGRDARVSLAAGEHFADGRGHVLLALESEQNSGIADQRSRSWGAQRWGVISNPADTGPNDGIPARLIERNVNLAIATEGGLILGPGPIANLQILPGGGLAPLAAGSIVSPPYMVGGDGANFGQYAALLQPYRHQNAFLAVDFDLTSNTTAFLEAGYAHAAGHSDVVQSFALGNLVIRSDNAFIPSELQTLLDTNHIPAFAMGRLNTDMGFIRTDHDERMRRVVLGVKGRIFDTWSWETYAQYGKVAQTDTLSNNFLPANFALATDAVRDANGNIVCRATLDPATAAAAAGCVPLNVFGVGAPSAAAIDYVSGTSAFAQKQDQLVGSAALRGDLLQLWAGPLSLAGGFEYRRERYSGASDLAAQTQQFLLGNGQRLSGSIAVKEFFAEGLLPLVADASFAKKIELNAAARLTDYDTIGHVTTSKLGVVWDTGHSVVFRASTSRDIRAPNVGELFAPQGTSFFTPVDPCGAASQAKNPAYAASCAAAGIPADFAASNGLIRVLSGGNPHLRAEAGRTETAGLVLAPAAVPDLRFSADFFKIKISDAIRSGTPVPSVLDACYSGAATSYCANIVRDSSHQLVEILSTALNVTKFQDRGIDSELGYAWSVPALFESGSGRMTASILGTYLLEQSSTATIQDIDRAGELRRDNSGLPKLRWNASLGYQTERVGLTAQVRYIGGGKYDNTYGAEEINIPSVPHKTYLDLSGRVPLKLAAGTLELFAGVNNVFDTDPAIVPYEFAISALATNPGLYDTIGRYFYTGVRLSL
jgi:outer membrane receptor protein involved in Fe transport